MQKKIPVQCIRKIQEYGGMKEQIRLSGCNKYFIEHVPVFTLDLRDSHTMVLVSRRHCAISKDPRKYKINTLYYNTTDSKNNDIWNRINLSLLKKVIVNGAVIDSKIYKKLNLDEIQILTDRYIGIDYLYHMKLTKLHIILNPYWLVDHKRFGCEEKTFNIEIFTNLKELYVDIDKDAKYLLKDNNIKPLTNLVKLTLTNCLNISDDSIKMLTNLEYLSINNNQKISDESIKCLTKLEELDISDCNKITDDSIKCLPLKKLILGVGVIITNEGIKEMKSLEDLRIYKNEHINDNGLKNLKQLKILSIRNNGNITDISISCLTQLQCLHLYQAVGITRDSIMKLRDLRFLKIEGGGPIDCRKLLPMLDIRQSSKRIIGLSDMGIDNSIEINNGKNTIWKQPKTQSESESQNGIIYKLSKIEH
jgi:hypothetical protein